MQAQDSRAAIGTDANVTLSEAANELMKAQGLALMMQHS